MIEINGRRCDNGVSKDCLCENLYKLNDWCYAEIASLEMRKQYYPKRSDEDEIRRCTIQ